MQRGFVACLPRQSGCASTIGEGGDVLAVDRFGASTPGEVMLREYGFTAENVCRHALTLLHR